MSATNCAVCHYQSRSSQISIYYHQFPKDPQLRQQWLELTGLVSRPPELDAVVCSRHFVGNPAVLQHNAIPTSKLKLLQRAKAFDTEHVKDWYFSPLKRSEKHKQCSAMAQSHNAVKSFIRKLLLFPALYSNDATQESYEMSKSQLKALLAKDEGFEDCDVDAALRDARAWYWSQWQPLVGPHIRFSHAIQTASIFATPFLKMAEEQLQWLPKMIKCHYLIEEADIMVDLASTIPQHHLLSSPAREVVIEAWGLVWAVLSDKLSRLSACGDVCGRGEAGGQLSAAEWRAVDAALLYLPDELTAPFLIYSGSAMGRPTRELLRLAVRYDLGAERRDRLAAQWSSAFLKYCNTGLVSSPLMLQRRWQQLVLDARRALRRRRRAAISDVHHIHWIIAQRWPHLLTSPWRRWDAKREMGLVVHLTKEEMLKMPLVKPLLIKDKEIFAFPIPGTIIRKPNVLCKLTFANRNTQKYSLRTADRAQIKEFETFLDCSKSTDPQAHYSDSITELESLDPSKAVTTILFDSDDDNTPINVKSEADITVETETGMNTNDKCTSARTNIQYHGRNSLKTDAIENVAIIPLQANKNLTKELISYKNREGIGSQGKSRIKISFESDEENTTSDPITQTDKQSDLQCPRTCISFENDDYNFTSNTFQNKTNTQLTKKENKHLNNITLKMEEGLETNPEVKTEKDCIEPDSYGIKVNIFSDVPLSFENESHHDSVIESTSAADQTNLALISAENECVSESVTGISNCKNRLVFEDDSDPQDYFSDDDEVVDEKLMMDIQVRLEKLEHSQLLETREPARGDSARLQPRRSGRAEELSRQCRPLSVVLHNMPLELLKKYKGFPRSAQSPPLESAPLTQDDINKMLAEELFGKQVRGGCLALNVCRTQEARRARTLLAAPYDDRRIHDAVHDAGCSCCCGYLVRWGPRPRPALATVRRMLQRVARENLLAELVGAHKQYNINEDLFEIFEDEEVPVKKKRAKDRAPRKRKLEEPPKCTAAEKKPHKNIKSSQEYIENSTTSDSDEETLVIDENQTRKSTEKDKNGDESSHKDTPIGDEKKIIPTKVASENKNLSATVEANKSDELKKMRNQLKRAKNTSHKGHKKKKEFVEESKDTGDSPADYNEWLRQKNVFKKYFTINTYTDPNSKKQKPLCTNTKTAPTNPGSPKNNESSVTNCSNTFAPLTYDNILAHNSNIQSSDTINNSIVDNTAPNDDNDVPKITLSDESDMDFDIRALRPVINKNYNLPTNNSDLSSEGANIIENNNASSEMHNNEIDVENDDSSQMENSDNYNTGINSNVTGCIEEKTIAHTTETNTNNVSLSNSNAQIIANTQVTTPPPDTQARGQMLWPKIVYVDPIHKPKPDPQPRRIQPSNERSLLRKEMTELNSVKNKKPEFFKVIESNKQYLASDTSHKSFKQVCLVPREDYATVTPNTSNSTVGNNNYESNKVLRSAPSNPTHKPPSLTIQPLANQVQKPVRVNETSLNSRTVDTSVEIEQSSSPLLLIANLLQKPNTNIIVLQSNVVQQNIKPDFVLNQSATNPPQTLSKMSNASRNKSVINKGGNLLGLKGSPLSISNVSSNQKTTPSISVDQDVNNPLTLILTPPTVVEQKVRSKRRTTDLKGTPMALNNVTAYSENLTMSEPYAPVSDDDDVIPLVIEADVIDLTENDE